MPPGHPCGDWVCIILDDELDPFQPLMILCFDCNTNREVKLRLNLALDSGLPNVVFDTSRKEQCVVPLT